MFLDDIAQSLAAGVDHENLPPAFEPLFERRKPVLPTWSSRAGVLSTLCVRTTKPAVSVRVVYPYEISNSYQSWPGRSVNLVDVPVTLPPLVVIHVEAWTCAPTAVVCTTAYPVVVGECRLQSNPVSMKDT